jgi:hypothetical protein
VQILGFNVKIWIMSASQNPKSYTRSVQQNEQRSSCGWLAKLQPESSLPDTGKGTLLLKHNETWCCVHTLQAATL